MENLVMSNRGRVIGGGIAALMLLCVNSGCSSRIVTNLKSQGDVKVTVAQGESSGAIMPDVPVSKIEGEKDGVTARLENGIIVATSRDAKVGEVELIVKDRDGKKAFSIFVTVKEHEIDLKFHVLGAKRVNVWQGADTEVRTSVVRGWEYTLGSTDATTDLAVTGKFQGAVKLSAEVSKGGKGLTVKFDPDVVKGNEQTSKLKIKAADDADVGEAVVRLTATTSEGRTASASVPLDVVVSKKQ
jgi:hypothetical protein